MWLSKRMGGSKVLDEMRARARPRGARRPGAAQGWPGRRRRTSPARQRSHVRLGNTLFVHGGLDRHADPDDFLAPPWTDFTEARWAWITTASSTGRQGFGGTLVVHGHTPPDKH